MYRWLLLSRPIDALVRLALTIRSEQIRLLNIFSDAEAMSRRDQIQFPQQTRQLQTPENYRR
jgi:hypothetical protein